MPNVSDDDLDKLIIERIVQAHKDGEPIEAGRGPYFDVQLKRALGLRIHQSRICTAMKRLRAAGKVRVEDAGRDVYSLGSHQTKVYPVHCFLPA